ncbi:DEAD/DEAH box helicase [Sphingobacterium corticis]|uniref:DEAD/DEAH box helicase n=1 Tax=Sphingobacterium corticis TaxID=1812823 RepID=A0ABW5NKV8_9SPHI
MRSTDHSYTISDHQICSISELDILSHYQLKEQPTAIEIRQLRVSSVQLNQVVFELPTEFEAHIRIQQSHTDILISPSFTIADSKLSKWEFACLQAVLQRRSLRAFFDPILRRQIIQPYAKPFGLQNEHDLDTYFDIQYHQEEIIVLARNKQILAVNEANPNASGIPMPAAINQANLPTANLTTILLMSTHRFYGNIKFEIIEAGMTQLGKPKAPFQSRNIAMQLWKGHDAAIVKFYAALAQFADAYEEREMDSDLQALLAIHRNPSKIPFYFHDREISDNITAKSIKPLQMQIADLVLVIEVFRRQPFYEIVAVIRWRGQMIPIKNIPIRHRYFLQKENELELIADSELLSLIAYFRKSPDRLLIHESKYQSFEHSVLEPLENLVEIHYSSVRKAEPEEQLAVDNNTEKLLYLSQRGEFIYLTPAMRYGNAEVQLASRKQLKNVDANGNIFHVQRNWLAEDQFKSLITRQHPNFTEQVHDRDFFYLHKDRFLENNWFLVAFENLKLEHIKLLGVQNLQPEKRNLFAPKIDIKVLSGTDWFNAELDVSYGDQQVSAKQLYRSIKNKSRFVQLDDGSQGVLPEVWLERLTKLFSLGDLVADSVHIPKVRFTELSELENIHLEPDVDEEIKSFAETFQNSDASIYSNQLTALKADLRPYQLQGLRWLYHLDKLNFGGCLADDMGLGKTLQIIALFVLQRSEGRNATALIVVPTSLLFNWQQELARFAPSLRVHTYYESGRNLHQKDWDDQDILLTTYGVMVSDLPKLKKFRFDTIVLDEAQAIKNPSSIRHKSALQLTSRNRFTLTGTPIENNTYDLYSQLAFASPGLLGNTTYFRDTYATPIDRFSNDKRMETLRRYTSPFILRRTKKQVIEELPEKTEMLIYCELGEKQRAIYDTYEAEIRNYVEELDEDEFEKDSMNVLAGLTRLRQIANAPVLLKAGYSSDISAKLDAMMEKLNDIVGEHKVLIFSQFVEMLQLIEERLKARQIVYSLLTGRTKNRESAVSNFQERDDVRVFLVSLKAGGVGLNLTAADYVFLMDPWWNPAVENQAIDRSYRIGQEKHVFAVRFIAMNTVEQKMMDLQQKKRDLASALVTQSGVSGKLPLTKSNLLSLFQ